MWGVSVHMILMGQLRSGTSKDMQSGADPGGPGGPGPPDHQK